MKMRFSLSIAIIVCLILVAGPLMAMAPRSEKAKTVSRNVPSGRTDTVARKSGKSIKKAAAPAPQKRGLIPGQSATQMPDGRWLLVGGEGRDGALSTAFIKEQNSKIVTPVAGKLQTPRAWHSATMLPDGNILVFGGVGRSGEVVDAVELFNINNQQFEPLPSYDLTPRAYHTATLLMDGQVLFAGGVSGDSKPAVAELWNSKTRVPRQLPAVMVEARQKHSAKLSADGNVLFWGGVDQNGAGTQGGEQFDTRSQSFMWAEVSEDEAQGGGPFLADSLPASGATGVSREAHLAMRFSKPLRAETVNSSNVTLTGAQGAALPATVVPAENGVLAFVTPKDHLNPGETYTLTINNAVDATGAALPFTSITFTTGGTDTHDHMRMNEGAVPPAVNQQADEDEWVPDASSLQGNWRSRRPTSTSESLPPLKAAKGETALSGQVLTLTGKPLANVTLLIGHTSARTDETGRFLLKTLKAGRHAMIIDGGTASQPNKPYAMFDTIVDVKAGYTNILPYKIWLPVIDRRNVTRVPAPTTGELVATTPRMPGLEVRIPKGVYLKYPKGDLLSELTLTPIPVDRPPFPLPAGVSNGILFTLQLHGAKISAMAGKKGDGIRIIYPNYDGKVPGTRVDLWNYDSTGEGWYVYGKGTVTVDGRQIVPDPGAELRSMHCATFAGDAPPANGSPGNVLNTGGDPIDLSTGHFGYSKPDLSLPDVLPISLTRNYRQGDTGVRAFGIGTTHPYEMFLAGADHSFLNADLILPGGGRVRYDRVSPGTGMLDMVLENTSAPTEFYKSRIVFNPDGYTWDLTLRDGTLYKFYAPLGKLILIRDRNGNSLNIARDYTQNHRITRIISNHGRWVEFSYDANNRITLAKDNIGRTVGYTYDTGGRLWKVTDSGNGLTEYTYDSSNRVLTIKDPRGIVYLTNEYDSNGRVMKQTLADDTPGNATDNPVYLFAYTVGSNGKITQTDVTDPRGYVRRVTFNSDGYTLTNTDALGMPEEKKITFERQAVTNFVQSATDALNRRTEYSYDVLGNITGIVRLAGTTSETSTTITYDPTFNQVASVTDQLNHTVTYAYSGVGNLESVTDALGHEDTFSYNSAGQLTIASDKLDNSTQLNYDSGDVVEVIDPLGRKTRRAVDAAGRVISVTNPLGATTNFQYNSLNLPTQEMDPLQGLTTFAYDPNGNLLSVTDAKQNVTSYTYDNMDRVKTSRDPLLHDEIYEYDKVGNLLQMTDRNGQVIHYTYDPLNRLKQVTFADTSIITYTYDAASRLTQVADSLSGTITYAYDDFDRLTSETTPQGMVSYTYNAAGQRSTMTVAGQPAVNYTYDDVGRLTQVTQVGATVTIGYDAIGRRTSLTLPNGTVTEYAYDAASELTSLTYKRNGALLGDLTYEYDPTGRRTKVGGSFARTLLAQSLSVATYNATNQQVTFGNQTLSYDLNGNLLNDGTNTYTWNSRDQLTSISGGMTAAFQYDSMGRRVSKTVNGSATNYLYDGGNAVQELAGATPTANLLYGGVDEVFSRTDAGGAKSPLTDALGSTFALGDSSGTMESWYTYDVFGRTGADGASSSNASQYTGRENDGTGLYYYRNRYYSPGLQRFISQDPLGFGGGDVNLYAYVGNDPVNNTDPSGLHPRNPNYPLDFGNGYWGRVDPTGNITGQGFEIHVVKLTSSGQVINEWIASGTDGWITKHKAPATVPDGMPDDTIHRVNSQNVYQLRRRDKLPENFRRGAYLSDGRVLFRAYSVLSKIQLGLAILDDIDLIITAGRNCRTIDDELYERYKRGPEILITPWGVIPNHHRQKFIKKHMEARSSPGRGRDPRTLKRSPRGEQAKAVAARRVSVGS